MHQNGSLSKFDVEEQQLTSLPWPQGLAVGDPVNLVACAGEFVTVVTAGGQLQVFSQNFDLLQQHDTGLAQLLVVDAKISDSGSLMVAVAGKECDVVVLQFSKADDQRGVPTKAF